MALYGFIRGLGSANIYSSGSQDCNNKFLVARLMYGAPTIQPVPDLGHTGCLICLGSNPAVSHSSFIHLPRPIAQLRAIERRGGSVWLVNPRRTETARVVGRQVFIRPGTDVFLLASFLHRVQELGGVDQAAVESLTEGWPQVRDLCASWPAKRTEAVTGIAQQDVHAMVDAYLEATRAGHGAALYCSTGVNQGAHGTLGFWLLNVINAVTGNLDHRGGVLVPPGLVDLPRLMARLGIGTSQARSRVGNFPAIMDTFPAGVLADEIETPGPGQVRAMFVSAGNPLLSCPDEARMRRAFASLDLLVSVDMFRNETGNLADYILPATSFLERPDLPLSVHGFATEPFAQYTEAVVEPAGQARDEWSIYRQLARACKVPFFGSRAIEASLRASEVCGRIPGLKRVFPTDGRGLLRGVVGLSRLVSMRQLRANPSGVSLNVQATGQLRGGRLMTSHGRIELAPQAITCKAEQELEGAFHRFRSPSDTTLQLISRRERHGHNSWMHNITAMHPRGKDTNYLLMHPSDAATRGLDATANVRVTSPTGHVDLPVKLSEDLMPGTVALPHGWGHGHADGLRVAQRAAGVNVNRLAPTGPATLERHTGMARLNGIEVEVTRAPSRTPASESG